MLYLIKGSRVREYRRQNVDLLSAVEHTPFEVSYSHRWVQDGLQPSAADGAVIVFADSPYQRFEPIRFAVVDEVDDVDGRLVVRGRVGPFVCTDDRDALSRRWSARDTEDPERPGRHRFLVADENCGLYTPRSPAQYDDAWRAAVDSLASNAFFEETTVARLVRCSVGDRDVEPGGVAGAGDVVTLQLELRTPHPVQGELGPTLVARPDGAAELLDDGVPPTLPATGTGLVQVRLLEPGTVELAVGVAGRSLASSWLTVPVEVRGERARPAPAAGPAGAVDVTAVARLLVRNAAIDDGHWLELLDDHLLPARPEDPALLSLVAEHAAALGRHDRALRALQAISQRTPAQQVRLLECALRCGANEGLDRLLDTTDLSNGDDFERFLAAVMEAPETTVHQVMRLELRNRYLGDERRARLVAEAWPRLGSVELMCEAAEHVAYIDPERGANLLLDQWRDPSSMPEAAVDLLLDWRVRRHLLGPYVRERLRRATRSEEPARVLAAVDQVDAVSSGDRPALLLDAGRALLPVRDTFESARGLELCARAVHLALEHDQVDLAIDAVGALRAWAATRSTEQRAQVEDLAAMVDFAITRSDELARWERMRSETRADALRPRTAGKRLFVLGGKPLEAFAQLADDLGLAEQRWVETDKDKGPNHDWADGLRSGDLVVAVLPWIGHAETSVKDRAVRKGAVYTIVRHSVPALLDGIERLVGGEGG